MKIIKYPNPILNKKLTPVNLQNPQCDLTTLKENLVKVMLENGGIGLSANQIGIDLQAFVMGNSTTDAILCVNPTVLEYTEEKLEDYEGCLSFPNMAAYISRPREILAKFYDENLEEHIIKISDYSAKCYLHELDHILGITMKDRVSRLKWYMTQKKIKKNRNKNGY